MRCKNAYMQELFDKISEGVWERIFSYLDLRSLYRTSQACKFFWQSTRKNSKFVRDNLRPTEINLPDELLLKIFSYLDAESVCKVAQVNKFFKIISDDKNLWKELCRRNKIETSDNDDAKETYIQASQTTPYEWAERQVIEGKKSVEWFRSNILRLSEDDKLTCRF